MRLTGSSIRATPKFAKSDILSAYLTGACGRSAWVASSDMMFKFAPGITRPTAATAMKGGARTTLEAEFDTPNGPRHCHRVSNVLHRGQYRFAGRPGIRYRMHPPHVLPRWR